MLLMASLLLPRCTAWRIEPAAPAELVAREHPSRIRVRTGEAHWEVLTLADND